ncbi:ribonuclease T [Gallaecimonas kandeliae]|uniref:ribonuclease T n=1 Tax=Gallaecimonas kandeliae TaxID=3029055 RepID=UPI0026479271|nr:ribonuclease T [Gallaecimonas kandeliae]WKE64377.1 ribonuclease T [Gallaecimonas kandeliae]
MSALFSQRFRGFYPVIIDVETAGFNAQTDALLQIAATLVDMDAEGRLVVKETHFHNVLPFEGANLEEAALKFTGITDPWHPLRFAVDEDEALKAIFKAVRKGMKAAGCQRAILVGHNAAFDLGFLNAVIARTNQKRSPFHPFVSFDTTTMAALALGQTVLAKACPAAGLAFDNAEAHAADYDAERTAQLFCHIVNRWKDLGGWPLPAAGAASEGNNEEA